MRGTKSSGKNSCKRTKIILETSDAKINIRMLMRSGGFVEKLAFPKKKTAYFIQMISQTMGGSLDLIKAFLSCQEKPQSLLGKQYPINHIPVMITAVTYTKLGTLRNTKPLYITFWLKKTKIINNYC